MEPVIFEKTLIEELATILDAPISVDTDLADAGLDSFGTMQVIVFLEETYGIQVLDDNFDIKDFASVTTIAQWALPMITTMDASE